MQRYEKLYIVTRRDLSPGLQAAQVAHAAFQFGYEHRPLAHAWLRESNFLVILSTEDEEELTLLGKKAETLNLPVSWFREPDIEDEVTAIAIAPSPATVELTSHLSLALSEMVTKKKVSEIDSMLRFVRMETDDEIIINIRGGA